MISIDPVRGSVDAVTLHLDHVRVEFKLDGTVNVILHDDETETLATWNVTKTAVGWDLTAQTRPVCGAVAVIN